jgi:hypothetical protein
VCVAQAPYNKHLAGWTVPVAYFSRPSAMNFKVLSVALGLLLSLAMSLPAQEPNGKRKQAPRKELTREEIAKLGGFEPAPEDPVIPAIVQIQLLVVSVPKADVLGLSAEFKNPDTAENAYRNVLEMIKKKKAKLVGVPTVETKPGNRCAVEVITEVRYATEFEKMAGGKPVVEDKADAVHALPNQAPTAIGVAPTAFETRNTGITLEAEPILGPDNKAVDLSYSAQHVQLLGWDTYSVEKKGEIVQRIPQPRFCTNKVTTNIALQVGVPVLGGVFEAAGAPDFMELFVIRVTTRGKKGK